MNQTPDADHPPWSFERTFVEGELADLVDAFAEESAPDARDALVSEHTHPDAREASEYFDDAEQVNAKKIDVEHAGLEARIYAARPDRWSIVTERPAVPGPTAQHLSVPEGVVIADDEGETLGADRHGLFEDHGDVYEPFREFLEELSEAQPKDVDPRVAAGVTLDLIREHGDEDWHKRDADTEEGPEA